MTSSTPDTGAKGLLMQDATPEALREELYEALGEPLGRLISTNNAERLRGALYRARREIGDSALDVLQIRLLSDERLAITKKAQQAPPPVEVLELSEEDL